MRLILLQLPNLMPEPLGLRAGLLQNQFLPGQFAPKPFFEREGSRRDGSRHLEKVKQKFFYVIKIVVDEL